MRVEVNFDNKVARCDFVRLPAVGHFVDMPEGRCLVDSVVHASNGGRPSLLCTLVEPAKVPPPVVAETPSVEPEPAAEVESVASEGETTVDTSEEPHPLRSQRRRNR